MAYTPTTLTAITQAPGAGPSIFHYTNTDAHTDVDASGYFSDGVARGMALYDLVFVIDTDTNTGTFHYVSAVNATTGAVTVSVSTLA